MQDTPGLSAELASFAAGLTLDQVPPAVVGQARRCLVDWLACTLAGSAEPESGRVRATLHALDRFDVGTAAVLGTEHRASALSAALANGFAAHVLDFDDTYNPGETTIHGSAPLWAAIASASELVRTSGEAAVAAFVAGFEVQARIGLAAGRGQYDVGWHVTGTVGHIGAAVAVARLLGLSPERTLAALGTGATQAAGMKNVYGSMGKALHPGKAAMDGLLAAFLARDGFTSSGQPIEGHRGFLHLFSPDPDPDRATRDLGTVWTLADNGFKPYACGSLTHPAAQAVLELRAEQGLQAADVAHVEAHVHEYVLSTTGNRRPTTGLEGKFSIFHVLAVALVDGAALTEQFTDARVHDPEVERARDLVSVLEDESQSKLSARVVLRLLDGRVLERIIPHNLGSPANPMSDEQLEEKLVGLATPVLGADAASRLAAACWQVSELGDLRTLLDLAVPAP